MEPSLSIAIIMLSGISSVNMIVVHHIGKVNWQSVKPLLVTGRALTGPIQGFARSSIIMERDIGIVDDGSDLSFDEQNKLRMAQDAQRRSQLIDAFNKEGGNIPTGSSSPVFVLAQPGFDTPQLYMESMRDAVSIIARVANTRKVVSGRELVEMFTGFARVVETGKNLTDEDERRIISGILSGDPKVIPAIIGTLSGILLATTGVGLEAAVVTGMEITAGVIGGAVAVAGGIAVLAVATGGGIGYVVFKKVFQKKPVIAPDPE
jgi:hypothetical protein